MQVDNQSRSVTPPSAINEGEGNVSVRRNNYIENPSIFSRFARFISEAFSSVISAISRAFSSQSQARAATANIRAGSGPYLRTPDETPRFDTVAPPLFSTIGKEEEIIENKMKAGKEQFDNILKLKALKKDSSPDSHIAITPEAKAYAHKRFEEYKVRKNNPNYSVTEQGKREIELICDITDSKQEQLLPFADRVSQSEQVKPVPLEDNVSSVTEIHKPVIESLEVHPGENAFLGFFQQWTKHNEAWRGMAKVNQHQIMLDAYADKDCIEFAEKMVKKNQDISLKTQPDYLKKLSAAHYLLNQNSRFQARKSDEQRREERRTNQDPVIAPDNNAEIIQVEIFQAKVVDDKNKEKKSLADLIELIPKADEERLTKKLNYVDGKAVDMKRTRQGLEILQTYQENHAQQFTYSENEIALLQEVLFFVDLIEQAYQDPRGNPVKAGDAGIRVFQDPHTERVVEKIAENRSEIRRIINDILEKNKSAVIDSPTAAVPSFAQEVEKPVQYAFPLPPPPASPPPPAPPAWMGVPAFPEITGPKVNQLYAFLYPDKNSMPLDLFRTDFFNFAVSYFSITSDNADYQSIRNPAEKHKASADTFSVQWKRAVSSRIPDELKEAGLIELYVNKHLEENPELKARI